MTDDGEQGAPTRRRRMLWIAAAAAAAVAVVLGIGFANGWGAGVSPSASPSAEEGAETPTSRPSSIPPSPSGSPSPSSTSDGTPPPETETPPPVTPRETLPPVPIDAPTEPEKGVTVSLSSIRSIEGEASVPGEVAGPAVEITVRVQNAGTEKALTDTLVVNVYYGEQRTPANILVNPRQDLPLSIDPGATAEGVYAFSVPADARGLVLVEVDLSVDLPVVLFEGAVS